MIQGRVRRSDAARAVASGNAPESSAVGRDGICRPGPCDVHDRPDASAARLIQENGRASDRARSDLSRAFSEDGALKTHVGGQALLEGIMMRGRFNWAVAVREPAGGIYTEEHDLASGKKRNSWLYWPLVRGCRAFAESIALGFKALKIAAEHAFAAEDEADGCASDVGAGDARRLSRAGGSSAPNAMRTADIGDVPSASVAASAADVRVAPAVATAADASAIAGSTRQESLLGGAEMTLSLVLGVVLGVVLFIVAPAFITNVVVGEYDEATLAWNVVDGLLRIGVFIFYIWLIGRMDDIKRMFGYHGAEHKAIHCFEHGLALTPENARSFPRLHVRCGTAFLIMVMIVAILVYTITPLNALIAAWGVPDGAPKLALVIAVRIVLLPLIAGASYEVTVKWAGAHPEHPLVKVVLWPGLQMQYLTTREPDDGQIECAIAAMRLVLAREEAEASVNAARTVA